MACFDRTAAAVADAEEDDTVATLEEAIADGLVPDRPDGVAAYNHWLTKRRRLGRTLLTRTEDPAVFRMADPQQPVARKQRKKTREQLEQEYLRMRVMRQELERVRALVEIVKKREKIKHEVQHPKTLSPSPSAHRPQQGGCFAIGWGVSDLPAPPALCPLQMAADKDLAKFGG